MVRGADRSGPLHSRAESNIVLSTKKEGMYAASFQEIFQRQVRAIYLS
jgi:hypothetical protein